MFDPSSPVTKIGKFTQSHRTASAVAALALIAVSTMLYLSPTGRHVLGAPSPSSSAADATTTTDRGSSNPDSSTTGSSPSSKKPSSSKTPTRTSSAGSQPPTTRTAPGSTVVRTKVEIRYPTPKITEVAVPTKDQLVHPTTKYYGLAEDGLPGDTSLFDKLANEAGTAPNMVEWFEDWDDSFPAGNVTSAWQRGALPVITWQSLPHDWRGMSNLSDYSWSSVLNHRFDRYLTAWAAGVAATRLPLVIRLDQEMNGNWYPWSAGYKHKGIANTPARFVQGWQYIWQIFDAAGANKYAIWAWTPSRTDTLKPEGTKNYWGDTGLKEDYPGDQYVDWLGMSGYQFRPGQPATYDFTFGGTVNGTNGADIGLKQVTSAFKPILIAEMGSASTIGPNRDPNTAKAAWTTETLQAVASDPQMVGFILFNNAVNQAHHVQLPDGTNVPVDTDWQFDTSPDALEAFQKGVANPVYGSGLMPADIKGTVRLRRNS